MKKVLLLCLLVATGSCNANVREAGEISQNEVIRVTSPDSAVDAVATVASVDATTPFVHRVYIVPRGAPVPSGKDHEEFRADHVHALTLAWPRARTLNIAYDTARIFQFSNFWNSRDEQDFRYTVELRLTPRHQSSLPVSGLPRQ
jgi:hypothetical protein